MPIYELEINMGVERIRGSPEPLQLVKHHATPLQAVITSDSAGFNGMPPKILPDDTDNDKIRYRFN